MTTLEWSAINYVDAHCLPTMRGWQQALSRETDRAVSAATSVSVGRRSDVSICSSEGGEVTARYNFSASNFRDTVSSPTEFQSNAALIGRAMYATVDSTETTDNMIVKMALEEATIIQRRCCTLL